MRGSVIDGSGAPAAGAAVRISNAVSGFAREVRSSDEGSFGFEGVPANTYRLTATLPGFRVYRADIIVRSAVPLRVEIRLELATEQTSVTVEGAAELLDSKTTAGDVVDRRLLASLPAVSPDSGLNDAILLTTAGVAADSNGFFHPLGDHAQVSYIIDGQPISDQRNKVFATSIPANAIQSMEVVSGSPQAEYGDKTSLVVNATTRSALGQRPSGSLLARYGSFGTIGEEATGGIGGPRWGNFAVFNAERSGRFLDTPEFLPLHDIGNTGAAFDRFDLHPGGRDALHVNALAARNWLQVPNTYDTARQDQRQKVVSGNLSAGYQRMLDARTLASVNGFWRRDGVDYYPSRNPLADFPATVEQRRTLENFGARGEVARSTGRHEWKAGMQATRTRLDEQFQLGLTDPSYGGALALHNLALGGAPFAFRGKADIDQVAAFIHDTVTLGHWTVSGGLRFDRYVGLTRGQGWQPRAAAAYVIKITGTTIRAGYSRTMETPANENLVASSSTGPGGLAGSLLGGAAQQRAIALGRRNQLDAGIRQSAGRWAVVEVDYFRKYTRNAFDFDALFGTPITFPIGWQRSKLDGVAARISTIELHGLRAYATMGHANARFFGPENGGLMLNSGVASGAFRQDHDQVYQQNVNIRYQPVPDGWWADFTWRYDSGLVVGAVNGPEDALALTADQQSMIGLYCGAERAGLAHRITSCGGALEAERIHVLPAGAENDDHNPPRTKSRHILNASVGTDNLFRVDRVRTTARVTVTNLTGKQALYNFLSPFSGTHWIAPRSYQVQLGWVF